MRILPWVSQNIPVKNNEYYIFNTLKYLNEISCRIKQLLTNLSTQCFLCQYYSCLGLILVEQKNPGKYKDSIQGSYN